MATDVVLHFGRPSIKFSFESMSSFGMDRDLQPHDPRRVVIIDVVLKYKRWILLRNEEGQVVDFYEENSDSYASFDCRPELSYSELRAQVRLWMPRLSPSLCSRLSQGIFVYARQQLAFASGQDRLIDDDNGGLNIVTAFVEIEEPQLLQPITDNQLLQIYTGRLRADIVVDDDDDYGVDDGDDDDDYGVDDDGIVLYDDNNDDHDDDDDDESKKPPRGLSWGEINGLKQESWFKSTGAENEEEECSICLQELSPGVKITPLPCSHTFHHNCIATWLRKQSSCPLCRFHITQLC